MPKLELVALIVREYQPAIDFFVNVLKFELVEDVPSLTNDGRAKRWVVVRPVGGVTGILLARAGGERQQTMVGEQFAGRVGLFLRVDDFEEAHARMVAAGVRFVTAPRVEPYGQVAVFLDIEGNRWDLLGPATEASRPFPYRGASVARSRINRGGWLAIGLAVLGSLIAMVNEIVRFRRTGTVDWGHVALIVGVPAIMYAIVSKREP